VELKLREYNASVESPDSPIGEENHLCRDVHKKGPPIQGRRKLKVRPELVRREWREIRERGEKENKSELARRLGCSVSLVRSILNRHESYLAQERRHSVGVTKKGLILGFEP
jgi:hypothetical protein